MKPVVGIIMGSDSDLPVMQEATQVLKQFEVLFEIGVYSAHRSPHRTAEYVREARNRGLKVIIAGAGSSAHLAGVTAAETTIPVIVLETMIVFRVIKPMKAVIDVENYLYATSQLSQTTLRSVLGQAELDDLLSQREKQNARLQEIIDTHTEPWGIKIIAVEVRDVRLPESMQRAMARQAEAEREKRARVLLAEGEFLASQQLTNAGAKMSEQPTALQLRYLETLAEIAAEKNSTILFPVPIDILQGLSDLLNRRTN